MSTPLDSIDGRLTIMATEIARWPDTDLDLVFDSADKILLIVARTSWREKGCYGVETKNQFLSRRAALVKQAETLSQQTKKHKTYTEEQLSLAI